MGETLTLKDRLREVFEGGGGEEALGTRFLPLVTLDSETRLGLDPELRWVGVPADGRPPFRCEPGSEHAFHEALETKRRAFEDQLEEGARAHGLPADEVVLAFPAVAVMRGVIAKGLDYTTRLALLWALPSELRELREDLVRLASARTTSAPIKELASRLIVPE